MDTDSKRYMSSVLILCLTGFASGAIDVFSFSQLGQVFASAMTGNIALVMYSLLSGKPAMLISSCIALASFGAGVVLSETLPRIGRFSRLPVSLPGMETLLFAAFALGAQAGMHSPGPQHALIALASCAMGIQIIIARKVGLSGIPTVVFTTTLTNALVGVSHGRPVSRDTKNQLLALAIYATGGLLSALFCIINPRIAVFLPLLAVAPVTRLWPGIGK